MGNNGKEKAKQLIAMQNKISKLFEAQLSEWELAKTNYSALNQAKIRKIFFEGFHIAIQFNAERIQSTCANKPNQKEHNNSCFLCKENLPTEQKGISFENVFTILCNPYPVFSKHLTIASNKHIPQSIKGNLLTMLNLAKALPDFIIFYNGPKCGASAPMHLHFQAGPKHEFPLYNDFTAIKERHGIDSQSPMIKDGLRTFHVLEGTDSNELLEKFNGLTSNFVSEFDDISQEPNLNILLWFENNHWTICIFRRKEHRPTQFYEEGDKQILISPAAVEMAGLLISPRVTDFEKITKNDLLDIYKQVIEE